MDSSKPGLLSSQLLNQEHCHLTWPLKGLTLAVTAILSCLYTQRTSGLHASVINKDSLSCHPVRRFRAGSRPSVGLRSLSAACQVMYESPLDIAERFSTLIQTRQGSRWRQCSECGLLKCTPWSQMTMWRSICIKMECGSRRWSSLREEPKE